MEEDYKKKYEEMVQRAKELHEAGNELTKRQMEIVCPDLKESEDEKIIQYLLVLCDKWDGGYMNVLPTKESVAEIRAWLEKQKAKERLDRMAPIYNDKESFESALEKAWKYYNESASRTVDSFEDDYIECVFSKGFREGFLYREKQKESLHISETCKENAESFTDEDERTRKEIVKFILYKVGHLLDEETEHRFIVYLKKQKKKKPAEWSEEDDMMLDKVCCLISPGTKLTDDNADYCVELKQWIFSLQERILKSLRPQPKEQDVEKYPEDKSFEDEWKDYYNNSLVSRLPISKREVAKHFYWFAKKNAWRPSEEQMEALEDSIRLNKTVFRKKKLESLLEQLKKLKDE